MLPTGTYLVYVAYWTVLFRFLLSFSDQAPSTRFPLSRCAISPKVAMGGPEVVQEKLQDQASPRPPI